MAQGAGLAEGEPCRANSKAAVRTAVSGFGAHFNGDGVETGRHTVGQRQGPTAIQSDNALPEDQSLMKAFWVSFYSYKGGVGRSMALGNLAVLLASRGRRVFMIDFDLEAPGLDSFKEFGIETKKQGVVEYVHEFQKTRIAPELHTYVQECKFAKPLRGNVWLMSSGKNDESYNAKRIAVNWEELYSTGLGEPFIANWKAAIHRLYKPDYVFVDSRTGLTDVGGICTLHLPDLVVLLFALNDQNLHGTAAVLQTIRNAPSPQPPQVMPVATPVPNIPRDEDGLLKSRL